MRHGRVIETGLTDQVLDDPREPYTQLLVSSVLAGMTQIAPVRRCWLEGVAKTFMLHLRGGAAPAGGRAACRFDVRGGRMRRARGPSGVGKSSILQDDLRQLPLRCRPHPGPRQARLRWISRSAAPHDMLRLRQATIGYVSQFLRIIPRVAALDIVAAAAAIARARRGGSARARRAAARPAQSPRAAVAAAAGDLLRRRAAARQHRPRLHRRACRSCCSTSRPPRSTRANRSVVVDLINERKAAGVAILGIFHDEDVRNRVADRVIDVARFTPH